VLLFQASEVLTLQSPVTTNRRVRHHNFLLEVDETVQRVLAAYDNNGDTPLSDVPECDRQELVIARALQTHLQDMEHKCPICWLQHNNYCCCADCPPVNEDPVLDRLFLVMHHREIGMGVDTAKLLLMSHPTRCRLVVAGIGSKYQSSMRELEDVIANSNNRNCLVLFPDEASRPFHEIANERKEATRDLPNHDGWNLIVIDGTWQQARRIKKRYFEEESSRPIVQTTRLSDKTLSKLERDMIDGELNPGHQLRKHSSSSRKVGTFEAVRLFLGDLQAEAAHDTMEVNNDTPPSWIQMEKYQQIANNALQAQNEFPC